MVMTSGNLEDYHLDFPTSDEFYVRLLVWLLSVQRKTLESPSQKHVKSFECLLECQCLTGVFIWRITFRITVADMLLPFLKFSRCPHGDLCLCIIAELRQSTQRRSRETHVDVGLLFDLLGSLHIFF